MNEFAFEQTEPAEVSYDELMSEYAELEYEGNTNCSAELEHFLLTL